MARFDDWGEWPAYVPVAQRRKNAEKKVESLKKQGKGVSPIRIEGRAIALSFWGKAWCDHLETYSDFSNRLPRGRTYVRNGSVIDLQVSEGKITALVSGTELYEVTVEITALESARWNKIQTECAGKVQSLLELLQGKFSQGVMEIMTCKKRGVFPAPQQITMRCSCPDSAVMCKHVAAVLYGIGARLDSQPELLFLLRKVDPLDLLSQAIASTRRLTEKPKSGRARAFKSEELANIFGIEVAGEDSESKRNIGSARKQSTRAGARSDAGTGAGKGTKTNSKAKARKTVK